MAGLLVRGELARCQQVLPPLEARFEAEGIGFIYEQRMGDAAGVRQTVEEGLHAGCLYHVTP